MKFKDFVIFDVNIGVSGYSDERF